MKSIYLSDISGPSLGLKPLASKPKYFALASGSSNIHCSRDFTFVCCSDCPSNFLIFISKALSSSCLCASDHLLSVPAGNGPMPMSSSELSYVITSLSGSAKTFRILSGIDGPVKRCLVPKISIV